VQTHDSRGCDCKACCGVESRISDNTTYCMFKGWRWRSHSYCVRAVLLTGQASSANTCNCAGAGAGAGAAGGAGPPPNLSGLMAALGGGGTGVPALPPVTNPEEAYATQIQQLVSLPGAAGALLYPSEWLWPCERHMARMENQTLWCHSPARGDSSWRHAAACICTISHTGTRVMLC